VQNLRLLLVVMVPVVVKPSVKICRMITTEMNYCIVLIRLLSVDNQASVELAYVIGQSTEPETSAEPDTAPEHEPEPEGTEVPPTVDQISCVVL